MDDPVTSPIITEEHKTTFHSVKDKTRCHFQSKTYVQSTRTLPRNLRTYTEQASTEELHTDLNNMQNTGVYSIQQMFLQF